MTLHPPLPCAALGTLHRYRWLFGAVGGFSVLLVLGSLAVIPVVAVRMRPDYFSAPRRLPGPWRRSHPVAAACITGLKNALGILLVVVGLLLVFTPGQGLLTMLIGLSLANYPGKYRFERWIITRPSVWAAVNWLRNRAGAPPLVRPPPGKPKEG